MIAVGSRITATNAAINWCRSPSPDHRAITRTLAAVDSCLRPSPGRGGEQHLRLLLGACSRLFRRQLAAQHVVVDGAQYVGQRRPLRYRGTHPVVELTSAAQACDGLERRVALRECGVAHDRVAGHATVALLC